MAFCSLAIRDVAGLKVDVEKLVREHVAGKRGTSPRARGKKKVLAKKAITKKKVLKTGTKKKATEPARSREGQK